MYISVSYIILAPIMVREFLHDIPFCSKQHFPIFVEMLVKFVLGLRLSFVTFFDIEPFIYCYMSS